MIDSRIAHSISALDEERWDAVAGHEMTMTHRWQRVLEASRYAYRPLYLLLEDRYGPLATIVMNSADSFGRTGWREALLRRLTLVVNAPFCAWHCGIVLRQGAALSQALPALERALGEICRRKGRLILGVGNVADEDLAAWQGRRYLSSRQPVTMVLDLDVPSYDQYLARLSSKDRSELRRIRRREDLLGVTFAHGPLADEGDRLYPLLAEVFARHGTPASAIPFTSELFAALRREMPGEVMLFRGLVQGQLAGFSLCLLHGETLWWPAAGLHYDTAHPTSLYFLLIDEMIRWSIENGYRRIYGGTTNEQQKARHGFRAQERSFCFRLNPRLLHSALVGVLPLAHRLSGTAAGASG